MKAASNTGRILTVAVGIIGGVWCVAVALLAGLGQRHLPFAGGVVLALVALALAVAYLLRGWTRMPRAWEVSAVPVCCTVLFLLASLLTNTLFVWIGMGNFNRFILVANLVLDAVWIVAVLFAERDARRVSAQIQEMEQKTRAPRDISGQLGALLGLAQDPEIRTRLASLKESVDYSSAVSTAKSAALEKQMAAQLDEVLTCVMRDADREETLQALGQAEQTWKLRIARVAGR